MLEKKQCIDCIENFDKIHTFSFNNETNVMQIITHSIQLHLYSILKHIINYLFHSYFYYYLIKTSFMIQIYLNLIVLSN
jgi:hypothetical protein